MKFKTGLLLAIVLATLAGTPTITSGIGQTGPGDWKAGVARENITPGEPIWLAGYSSRTHPSEGKLHDLWVKALAIEDLQGNRAVLVTADLLGFPKKCSDNIRNILQKELNLSKSQIILNGSHTHTGPVLAGSLPDIYPMDSTEWEKVGRYTARLENQVVQAVKKAFGSMAPATIMAGNGTTRFQVNRRNNIEKTLSSLDELKGPNDYSVPVIKVSGQDGQILAIVFGYACHGTVLNDYLYGGDYPGFAQIELEKWFPGTTAMFAQGAAGDQNPLPRRSVALAQQYGTELAAAVKCALNEKMKPLPSFLSTAYSEVQLPFEKPASDEELETMARQLSGFQQSWAKQILQEKHDGSIMSSYPYPLELWNIGGQLLFALGGEPVIEYPRKLKEIFGPDLFVFGYSNDLLGYIPSVQILKEGGYEGEASQKAYGLPAKWKPDIEKMILSEAITLAGKTGIPITDELKSRAKSIFDGIEQQADSSLKPSAFQDTRIYKIRDKAPHNAFTGLIRHNNCFYCAFREGSGHGKTDPPKQIPKLPSGGDTSYPGMLFFNDKLWISYFPPHEANTAIYIAQIPDSKLIAVVY